MFAWSIIKYIADYFWNTLTLQGKVFILGCLLFFILLAFGAVLVVKRLHRSDAEKRRAEEALSQQGQIAIDEAKENANQVGSVANQSVNEANQARNANIANFGNNYNETRRKYCERFPKDCL